MPGDAVILQTDDDIAKEACSRLGLVFDKIVKGERRILNKTGRTTYLFLYCSLPGTNIIGWGIFGLVGIGDVAHVMEGLQEARSAMLELSRK